MPRPGTEVTESGLDSAFPGPCTRLLDVWALCDHALPAGGCPRENLRAVKIECSYSFLILQDGLNSNPSEQNSLSNGKEATSVRLEKPVSCTWVMQDELSPTG